MNNDFWNSVLRNQFVPLAAILGIALIIATLIGAGVAYHMKSLENTLSVTGSAKTEVTADSVHWSLSISRTTGESNLSAGQRQLDTDLAAVKRFLSSNGVPDSEVQIDPVMTSQVYDNNTSAPIRYTLSRMITVHSARVNEIGELAQRTGVLADEGVVAQANAPEYYYTKLSDLRVTLLSDAIKDAKARADAIAKESGQSVGKLQSSTSGVVQVLAPDAVDVDDYGQYDTSSVDKEVMVTIHATFFVE